MARVEEELDELKGIMVKNIGKQHYENRILQRIDQMHAQGQGCMQEFLSRG